MDLAAVPTESESKWWTVFDDEDVPHVLPEIGPKHRLSMACWCHPVIDPKYTQPAVSHNVAH